MKFDTCAYLYYIKLEVSSIILTRFRMGVFVCLGGWGGGGV